MSTRNFRIVGNDYHRFWAKVVCRLDGQKCWEFQGTAPGDYGRFNWEGRTRKATHVLWFLTFGEWPDRDVLHYCDNPPCVWIEHLHLGTAASNSQEKRERGRANPPIGERARHAKLSADQVATIRKLRAEGVKLRVLAATYGVSVSTIGMATSGGSWKHL